MIQGSCIMEGAAVSLLIVAIIFMIPKQKHRFLKTEFFLGFSSFFLYFVTLLNEDFDFWDYDFLRMPNVGWKVVCAVFIPLLAAALTAVLYLVVHRIVEKRQTQIVVCAAFAGVILCLFLLSDNIYSKAYDAARKMIHSRVQSEELELIEGQGSSRPFSYLIPVSDGQKGYGFVNEYGEEVISCQFAEYGPYGRLEENFCLCVQKHAWLGEHAEDWRWYIIDENGKQVGEQYYSDILAVSEEKNMILVRSEENFKYGAVDGEGNEVLPFQYDYEQIYKEAGISPETDSGEAGTEKVPDGLHIEEDEEGLAYVTDDGGKIIIPPYNEQTGIYHSSIWPAENGAPYLLAKTFIVDDDEIIYSMELYDYQGRAALPEGIKDISADSENGWIYMRDEKYGDIVFLDENLETVLELGSEYECARGVISLDDI